MRRLLRHIGQAAALACLCLLSFGPALAETQDDWQRALQLARGDNPSAALPILERLVSEYPGNAEYRFELAYVLAQTGRDTRARYHLDLVRGATLTPAERRLVDSLTAEIDTRRIWTGYLSFDLRPETNGTKQTAQQTISVGGLPFTLAGNAIGKPTVSTILAAGATYSPLVAPGLRAQFSLDGYFKHNVDPALRDHQVSARIGLNRLLGTNRLIEGGLLLSVRRVADAPYSQTLGVYGELTRTLGLRGLLVVQGELSRAFRRGIAPPVDRLLVAASYQHALSATTQLAFGGFAERNSTTQGTVAGNRIGVSLWGSHAFPGGIGAAIALRAETDDRDGIEPLFGLARSDRKIALDLRLHHRQVRLGGFAPELILGVERNRSNISLADYRNTFVSMGLTRNF